MRNSVLSRATRTVVPVVLLAGAYGLALAFALGARLEEADFTFNNGTEPQTLDPATVTGVPEGRVIRMLYEGLVVSHPETLEPVPGVAESWEVSDDGLVYTFHLRRDAKWSDGSTVTSADFLYSYERFLSPATAAEYAYQLWYVKGARAFTTETKEVDGQLVSAHSFDTVGITAPDEWTVRFELEAPTPYFMELMAFYPQFPVNRGCIERAKEEYPDRWQTEWMKPENLVCNGPYVIEFRRVNDRIRFRKNPHYWDRENVAFETVDATAVEQYTTMLNMYLTGEVQWIDRIATSVVQELMPREDFNPIPYLGTYFYRVNVTQPPFDDPRVRRALALTIPRRKICEKITKAGQVPAYALVPPGLPGYENAEMPHAGDPTKDGEEARRLLAEAGFGPGGKSLPTIEIHYNTSEAHRDIALVIADAWSTELGLRAKLLNQEWKVYLDTQSNLGYDVSRAAWIGDYADPNTFIDMFVTDGENNKTGWGHPEYDRLVKESALELDPERRMEMLKQAEAILVDELPIIPIYFYVTQSAYSPRLGGYFENIKDEHFPKFWYWMDDEELAAKRAGYPDEGYELVEAQGPSEGLYSPAEQRRRAAAAGN